MKLPKLNFMLAIIILLVATGIFAQSLPSPTILATAWNPDGTLLAVGGTEGLRVIDIATRQALPGFQVSSLPVYAVAWSPDGNRLVGSGEDTLINIWNVTDGALITSLAGHDFWIADMQWSPDGTKLATGNTGVDERFSLRIWDMVNYQPLDQITGGHIAELLWIDDSKVIVVSTSGGALMLDLFSPPIPGTNLSPYRLGVREPSGSIALHPNGTTLAISSFHRPVIYLWDITADQLLAVLEGHTDFVLAMDWHPDGDKLVSVSLDGTLRLWDATSGQQIDMIDIGAKLYTVNWHPDGQQLAYGGETPDGVTEIFKIIQFPTADAGTVQTIIGNASGVATVTLDGSASFDPDGEIVSYVWTLDGVEIATGVSPAVTLEVGEHVITLTVTDTDGASEMDSVVVTVLPLSGLMSAGIYNDNDSGLVYSGTWSVISSQHLFNGSATYTQTANDTMIFYVDGDTVNSVILYRTLDGTSLGSMRVQVEGRPRAGEASLVYVDRVVANNDVAGGFLTQAEAIVRIGPGIQKITVTNPEANLFTAIDAVELVGVQTVMTEPNTYNSHDGLIHFSLKWQDRTAVDSYGGNFKLNFEPNASAIFAIDGDGVVIYHSTNTDRRQVEICFTNEAHEEFCQVLNQYTGAQWLGTRTVVRAPSYDRYTVEIRNYRDANGEYGNFSIEGIEVLGIQQPLPPSTTMYQEENSQMRYTGLWHTRKSYWSLGTDIVELYDGSTASFLIDVDEVHTINFYYRGNAHYGMAQLCIDVCIPFDQNRPLRQDGELLVVPVSSLINTGTTGIATVVFTGTDADTRLVTIEAFELLGE